MTTIAPARRSDPSLLFLVPIVAGLVVLGPFCSTPPAKESVVVQRVNAVLTQEFCLAADGGAVDHAALNAQLSINRARARGYVAGLLDGGSERRAFYKLDGRTRELCFVIEYNGNVYPNNTGSAPQKTSYGNFTLRTFEDGRY